MSERKRFELRVCDVPEADGPAGVCGNTLPCDTHKSRIEVHTQAGDGSRFPAAQTADEHTQLQAHRERWPDVWGVALPVTEPGQVPRRCQHSLPCREHAQRKVETPSTVTRLAMVERVIKARGGYYVSLEPYEAHTELQSIGEGMTLAIDRTLALELEPDRPVRVTITIEPVQSHY